MASVWRSSLATFSAYVCFHQKSRWRSAFIPRNKHSTAAEIPRRATQRRFSFPSRKELVRSLRGFCFWLGAAEGLILNTGPLPATFPGLKSSCSQRLWGAVAELYEEQASCRMLKPRLNYTGESGSLSLSSKRMNQMIPLLVSHQLFCSCCARQSLTSWGMWPQWTAVRGNYLCIQIEFVP